MEKEGPFKYFEAYKRREKPMIIDCHLHVKGGDVYKTESKAEEIIACMDRAGIDKGVVFAMCTSTVEATEMTWREVNKYPDRLIGFTYARPCYNRNVTDDIRFAFEKRNMKGIKIHRGETLLLPEVIGPVLETAIEYDYPCLIDSGNDLAAVFEIMKTYPELKLILAHLGCPSGNVLAIDNVIRQVKDYKNVWLDTAYLPTYWKIKDAVNALGAERILFGSDGILVDPRTELRKIDVLDLTDEQKELILGKNIARLLKLE